LPDGLGREAVARAAEHGYAGGIWRIFAAVVAAGDTCVLVVATNAAAIALWESLGFAVVGRVAAAFHWRRERYVDGLVMSRSLESAPRPLLGFSSGAEGSCPTSPGLR